jgi:hypothetical protein
MRIGSSKGRGAIGVGWFDDYIKEQEILEKGMTGWAGIGEEFTG